MKKNSKQLYANIGNMLKDNFLDPLGMSQNELGHALGVPPNRIHAIVNGQRRVTADTDLRLARFFGISEGFFLDCQTDSELQAVRRRLGNKLDGIMTVKQWQQAKQKNTKTAGKTAGKATPKVAKAVGAVVSRGR